MVKLTLTEQHTQAIMEILMKVSLPYETTAPIINAITEQLKEVEVPKEALDVPKDKK